MGTITGVAFVRQELDLVAPRGSSVAQQPANDRGGDSLAAMACGNRDCFDERGRRTAVGQVWRRYQSSGPAVRTVQVTAASFTWSPCQFDRSPSFGSWRSESAPTTKS